jgi:hypothetical protein
MTCGHLRKGKECVTKTFRSNNQIKWIINNRDNKLSLWRNLFLEF